MSGEPSGDQLSNWYSQKLRKEKDVCIETQQSSSLEFRIASGPLALLKNLPGSIKFFRDTANYILENDFDEVVLVDFPFINIPMAWPPQTTQALHKGHLSGTTRALVLGHLEDRQNTKTLL